MQKTSEAFWKKKSMTNSSQVMNSNEKMEKSMWINMFITAFGSFWHTFFKNLCGYDQVILELLSDADWLYWNEWTSDRMLHAITTFIPPTSRYIWPSLPRMANLVSTLGQMGPKWDKSGIFKVQFQYILDRQIGSD